MTARLDYDPEGYLQLTFDTFEEAEYFGRYLLEEAKWVRDNRGDVPFAKYDVAFFQPIKGWPNKVKDINDLEVEAAIPARFQDDGKERTAE